MTLILKHYGAVRTKTDKDPGKCGGSSKFMNYRDKFTKDIDLVLRKSKSIVAHQVIEKGEADVCEKPKKVYRMNVPKFKAKACAYAQLRKSETFLAFYSISFPAGLPDDTCYKIFNSSLSQLRKNFGLKSYMWVMERQENNTVHYHMLTNDFIYVRDVNSVFAHSIDYQIKKNNLSWGRSSREKYNGVDVKSIVKKGMFRNMKSRKKVLDEVIRYLSKYMSKELRSENHRVWHCSRLVSALFTTVSYSEDIAGYILSDIVSMDGKYKRIETFYCEVYFCATILSEHWIETVNILNEKVYEWFVENEAW